MIYYTRTKLEKLAATNKIVISITEGKLQIRKISIAKL